MTSLTFRAVGIPKGQPRARACIRGRHAGIYDPGTADDWKSIVRAAAMKEWDKVPFDGPLSVDILFWIPRPKSHYKRQELRDDAPYWCVTKPDRDNLDKAVLDALTSAGIIADDCLVAAGNITKLYASELPGAEVVITRMRR